MFDMNSSGIPTEVPVGQLLSSTDALLATKYLAGCSLTISLWDTMITFDDEVRFMWPRGWDLTQVVFFLNRYGIAACLIYINYMLSGLRSPLNENGCKVFVLVLCILTVIYSLAANAYVTLRHYTLWDHRRGVIIALFVALAVTYIPVFVLGGISIKSYYEWTYYVAALDTCIVAHQPPEVKGFWACMVAFDVFVITLTTINALDKPRRHQHAIITSMRRDGALSFVALFLMRLLNFLLNTFLPPEQIFIAVFLTWSLISITLSRMILRIESVRKPRLARQGKINTWVPERNAFELSGWSTDHT